MCSTCKYIMCSVVHVYVLRVVHMYVLRVVCVYVLRVVRVYVTLIICVTWLLMTLSYCSELVRSLIIRSMSLMVLGRGEFMLPW